MLATGQRLGPYEILDALGAGGIGEVYRARDSRLGRDVALKVLPADRARDPDRLRRFETEARAVAALTHPHILAVHDMGTEDGLAFVVFEPLKGGPCAACSSGPARTPAGRRVRPCRCAAGSPPPTTRGSSTGGSSSRRTCSSRATGRSRSSTSASRSSSTATSPGPGETSTTTDAGVVPRDRGLHVAGAGAGTARRRAVGPLFSRGGALRDALGAASRSRATPPPTPSRPSCTPRPAGDHDGGRRRSRRVSRRSCRRCLEKDPQERFRERPRRGLRPAGGVGLPGGAGRPPAPRVPPQVLSRRGLTARRRGTGRARCPSRGTRGGRAAAPAVPAPDARAGGSVGGAVFSGRRAVGRLRGASGRGPVGSLPAEARLTAGTSPSAWVAPSRSPPTAGRSRWC